ncbi:MAG: GNAT family N-acetyltransferase [Rhizomicrobium sp.]
MPLVRPYRPSDLDALYGICLQTGDAGQDATALYRDPKLLGQVYAAPYAVLEPESCFVVEDDVGIGGYIVGTRDTHGFEKRQLRGWWPALRAGLADPGEDGASADGDARMAYLIHHPARTPRRINEPYPAHLHINCLPRLQGMGMGKRLLDTWLAAMAQAGATAAHLGVGPRNARAVRFYKAYGFHLIEQLPPPWDTCWFGISTGR